MKTKGIVVAVDTPKSGQLSGFYAVKLAIPKTKGYATEDDGESWVQYDRRVALVRHAQVYLNYRPEIGQWITARTY